MFGVVSRASVFVGVVGICVALTMPTKGIPSADRVVERDRPIEIKIDRTIRRDRLMKIEINRVKRIAPPIPRMTGPHVTVFNASVTTCGANGRDNVDSPARAFVDSEVRTRWS